MIATVLSNTSEGISYLLGAFKDEYINPDIATEIPIMERLAANANAEQQNQIDKFLASEANDR